MPWVHHTVLHFVLGLAFLPPLLGALTWRRDRGEWPRELRLVVYFTALSAIVAAASGLLSAAHVIEGGLDASKVALHRNLGLIAAGTWVAIGGATYLVAGGRVAIPYRGLTVASAIGTALVSLAGHFGGDMLHPGLAPWASAPHSHGPAPHHEMHDDGHDHDAPATDAAHTHDHGAATDTAAAPDHDAHPPAAASDTPHGGMPEMAPSASAPHHGGHAH